MITSIRGTLEAAGPDWVEVAIGGVCLKVFVPLSLIEGLPAMGKEVRLFTHLQVKEDSLVLFGFTSAEARRMFEMLLTVNGVGPRLALSLLSAFTPESLVSAVSSGDLDSLTRVQGIGKKTASRVVLELKGKLEKEWAVPVATGGEDGQVAAALMALGYTAAEVRSALSGLSPDKSLPLEERVRAALQRLTRG